MNQNKANSPPASLGPITKALLTVVLLWLFIKVPTFLKYVLLLIAAVGPGWPYFKNSFNIAKALVLPLVNEVKSLCHIIKAKTADWTKRADRMTAFISRIWKMDDKEFESVFSDLEKKKKAPSPQEQEQPTILFLPESLCKQILDPDEAMNRAQAWWTQEDVDGCTGEMRLAELLANIASEDPTIHTCLLNDYEELRLPTEAPVLLALTHIFRENGIAADCTPDDQVVVSWGQDTNGLEAGMA